MRSNRIIGIFIIIVGGICLLFSRHIANEIMIGEGKIARGQQMVDTTNAITSQTSYTKPLGNFFTGGAQNQINAGREEIAYYKKIVLGLQIAGIVLIIVGVVVGFYPRKKRQ